MPGIEPRGCWMKSKNAAISVLSPPTFKLFFKQQKSFFRCSNGVLLKTPSPLKIQLKPPNEPLVNKQP